MQRHAASEMARSEAVFDCRATRWAVVPLQAEEPVGVERLRALARH